MGSSSMGGVPLPELPGESVYVAGDDAMKFEPWFPAKGAVAKDPEA